ncbi:MAG: hypothetical protein H7Y37_05715 [Anaerolineae bacterium]|nr:hypothetical protein [Gloeobacterales cyanobacterium ES-bin-313]
MAEPTAVASEPVILLDVTMTDGQPYVSLMDVANRLKAKLEVLAEERVVRLIYGDLQASIGENALLSVNQQLVLLSIPPYWSKDEMFVPLDAVQKIFYADIRWRIQTRQVVFLLPRRLGAER